MTASQLVSMGYYGYAGWGDAAADADFKATNGAGKGGPQQGAGISGNVNASIEDSFRRLNEEVNKRFGEYKSKNPFRIDEVLKMRGAEAKEQIDPYYNETLNDYITGVTRKVERGTQDTKDLLSELQADTTSFNKNLQLTLDESINKAKQGFAGAGLLNSGQSYREEGLMKRGAEDNLNDFTRKQDFRSNQLNTGLSRNLEDLGMERKQTVRDIERSRFTDTEQRKSQLAKESGQKFVSGFRATLPPELQANSGFDLLQDLGIYS